jgi:hypothetical protein
VRFDNKNIIFYFEKCSSLLQRLRYGCKFRSLGIGSRKKILSSKFFSCFFLSSYKSSLLCPRFDL